MPCQLLPVSPKKVHFLSCFFFGVNILLFLVGFLAAENNKFGGKNNQKLIIFSGLN
jgi:hypothetical protein